VSLPVGVFVKRQHMVLLTVKQLVELKAIVITNENTRLVLHMKFNQGKFMNIIRQSLKVNRNCITFCHSSKNVWFS
jgi:hypothetical protein